MGPTSAESISRRINGERLVVLGWPRAVLMQLAHPLVAAGVNDHSTFREGRFGAVRRLGHTVDAMLALTFGDSRDHGRAIRGIASIHRRVHGELGEPTGPHAAGAAYSAEDPALVLWVHATLVESMTLAYERAVHAVSEATKDRYLVEAAPVAVALGAIDTDVPRSWVALQRYLSDVVRSGELAVGKNAAGLADALLSPPYMPIARPVGRWITRGLLPEEYRAMYGLSWSVGEERRLERLFRGLRVLRRGTPARVARWQMARF